MPPALSQLWPKVRDKLVVPFWIGVVLSPFAIYIVSYRASLKPASFTVDRRERVVTGSGDSTSSYYLVWSKEGEVFAVLDTWSFLRWDSSDRYGQLREGSRVSAKVAGWRIPFLSAYRNVVVIDGVAPPAP